MAPNKETPRDDFLTFGFPASAGLFLVTTGGTTAAFCTGAVTGSSGNHAKFDGELKAKTDGSLSFSFVFSKTPKFDSCDVEGSRQPKITCQQVLYRIS